MIRYICFSEYYLPQKGGHIVWLHEVCKRLGGVQVLTGRVNGFPLHERIENVEIKRINLSRLSALRPESLFLYANFIARGILAALSVRPVAILAARVLPEGLVGGIIGRILNLPVITLAHGEEIAVYGVRPHNARGQSSVARLKRCLIWKSYGMSTVIIANSRFTARLLQEGDIPPKRIRIIHPGTDPTVFCPRPKNYTKMREWGVREGPVLLTVGRLCDRKGQDVVLSAMPRILEEFPSVQYIVAGEGPKHAELVGIAKELGIDRSVRFLGLVDQEDLPELYNVADLFIMPNRILEGQGEVEGFGIVFIEASASGKPVIGGDSGGTEDSIQDGFAGLRIDGRKPHIVAEAVIRVLSAPDWARRLGEAGRQRVLRQFTWDHSAAQIRDVIHQISR